VYDFKVFSFTILIKKCSQKELIPQRYKHIKKMRFLSFLSILWILGVFLCVGRTGAHTQKIDGPKENTQKLTIFEKRNFHRFSQFGKPKTLFLSFLSRGGNSFKIFLDFFLC